ncbi:disease resistance protein [Salix suchowensis]|nr:disease resistance protein [Salix suchowensis]
MCVFFLFVRVESEFIEKIVGDVLNKLHGMSSSHTTGLFGIDDRVNKVESLLNMESQDVVIVGIWGMGGIGKTTIAEAVCNKGTEEIEGISLNISQLSRQIHLKLDAFAMMDGLRFLKFNLGHFSEDNKDKMLLPPTGLEYLSNKLIYFHWDGFPSRSLPQRFCGEHLVELDLSWSKVEKLWTGVQDIGNLRNIVLYNSPYLTELPDLSKAKNLVCLNLECCDSLTEVPSSLQHLDKLEELNLYGCFNIRSFPMLDSKVLRELAISRCLDITKCPTISQNMKWLELNETSLKEVPQSITSKVKSLALDGCSKITKFPEVSGI